MIESIKGLANRYLSYGIGDYGASTQRRMRVTNAFTL